MYRSILMSAVAGMRSMTPLAVVSDLARRGQLPADNGAPAILAHPLVSAGTALMAAGELGGDKMPSAPDRIVVPGLAARLVTGAVAGMAFAPREQRVQAAAIGAAVAIASSYLTFNARIRSMERHDQVTTGLVEDAITLGAAALVGYRPQLAGIPR